MEHVISGVARFQTEVYPARQERFQKLANGQNDEYRAAFAARSAAAAGEGS